MMSKNQFENDFLFLKSKQIMMINNVLLIMDIYDVLPTIGAKVQ